MLSIKIANALNEYKKTHRDVPTKLILNANDYVRLTKAMSDELGIDMIDMTEDEIIASHYLGVFMGLNVVCRFSVSNNGFMFE